MKLERSRNAVRNMKVGLINKIVALVSPFVVRTVFIRTLGAEYLGVNSLFTSILSVLSLTELGFGSAIVFSMYKAIADDDSETMNALLYFYRKIYRCIGLIILSIGLCLIPFLPKLVHGSYPQDIQPVAVYLVFLGNTVVSYFMYAYLSSLLNAFQRSDVSALINMSMNIIMCVLQIVLLIAVKNYYLFLLISPIFSILSNVRTAYAARKMFPQYSPCGTLKPEIKEDIKEKVSGLMIQKLCEVSRNSFDSVFISMFLGLTEIAIYNNYYYIVNSITGVMLIVTSSVMAGAGNSVASESVDKNYQDMKRMNFVYMWISGWCTICLLCLFQPFMRIWVGKQLLLPFSSVVLLCLYFYTLKMGDIRTIYSNANGIWWQNRYRSIAESVLNIVLNFFLGKYFGINGIICATLISLLTINFCYGSTLIYKYYFTNQKISDFFLAHGCYAAVTFFIALGTLATSNLLPNTIVGFILKMGVCIIVPNILYLLIYHKTETYRNAMPWILSKVGIHEGNVLWKVLNL